MGPYLLTPEIKYNKSKKYTCIISGASGPHMEAPITLSVSASTMSFMTVFSCLLHDVSSYILGSLQGQVTQKSMTNEQDNHRTAKSHKTNTDEIFCS